MITMVIQEVKRRTMDLCGYPRAYCTHIYAQTDDRACNSLTVCLSRCEGDRRDNMGSTQVQRNE